MSVTAWDKKGWSEQRAREKGTLAMPFSKKKAA
jgi:hypothetical protein